MHKQKVADDNFNCLKLVEESQNFGQLKPFFFSYPLMWHTFSNDLIFNNFQMSNLQLFTFINHKIWGKHNSRHEITNLTRNYFIIQVRSI